MLDLEHKGAKRMAYLRHTSDPQFCSNFCLRPASLGLASSLPALCVKLNRTSTRGGAKEVLECR